LIYNLNRVDSYTERLPPSEPPYKSEEMINKPSNEPVDLKKLGLKATHPRIKILHILENAVSHLRAEEIYNILTGMGEEIALATVYRVLTQFEEAGLIIKHHFDADHSVFELNKGEHHDHLVCLKCGRIDEFFDEAIEARQLAVAQTHGYQITHHTMYLYGACSGCAN
jgi:Fur family ferric uptake transcriptional regulator